MGGGIPAYRVSKAALNALTRMLAAELRTDHILVQSVCPGWVATHMGGPGGRPVADGAASVRWALDLPDDGPTGGSSATVGPCHGSPRLGTPHIGSVRVSAVLDTLHRHDELLVIDGGRRLGSRLAAP